MADANLFYRNTNAKISFEALDEFNNPIGLSTQAVIYYYIKTPDNYIISNDPQVALNTYSNGIGVYTSIPAVQQDLIISGSYYITYVLTKVGVYKYKWQVVDNVALVNVSSGGDIIVQSDGIF